jgi:hypothetical protein
MWPALAFIILKTPKAKAGMTPMNKILNAILIVSLTGALVVSGCGGGSISVAEGGIGGTGISTGTVTGIGSIKVNGVTFNTDNAAIYVEGVRVDDQCPPSVTAEQCLREYLGFNEGQVVRVVGSFNADGKTGTADAVYYNDSIEGPVETRTTIDVSTLELVVMDQTVIVNSQTFLFDTTHTPITLNDINEGDLIEVSGLIDETGKIYAGYLLNKGAYNAGDSVEIKGVIDSGSITPNNFEINGLLIDYSAVSPDPSLQGGMQVEVKGTYTGTRINAISIEQDDDIAGRDDDDVEYEGIVTTAPVVLGGDFVMGIQPVQTSPNTVYKGGLVEDIAVGVHLEVEGYLQGGILMVDEVRFRDAIEIDAQVASYTTTPANDSMTIQLTGLTGINIFVNEVSKISVSSGTDDLDGLINALGSNNPDYVEVRGRCLNCDNLSALERDVFAEEIKLADGSNEQKVKLQGPIEDIDIMTKSISILNIDIVTDPNMEFEAIDDSTAVDQDQFFNLITIGNIVEAEGNWNGVSIDWEEVGLEDEE